MPFTPQVGEAVRARLGRLVEDLGSHVSGRKPLNALAPGESVADVFGSEALGRLRRIKQERDPHGVVRANYPVLG